MFRDLSRKAGYACGFLSDPLVLLPGEKPSRNRRRGCYGPSALPIVRCQEVGWTNVHEDVRCRVLWKVRYSGQCIA